MKVLLALLFIFSLNVDASQLWRWEGVEIIGHQSVSRISILKEVPIKKGEEYKEDPIFWKKVCSSIKAKFNFIYADCSAVRYSDFKAFFIINIVEKGNEHRIKFREASQGNIQIATDEIIKVFDSLQSRMWELFNQGLSSNEYASKGYLDYEDKAMSSYVAKLVKLVPKYRENLIDVIKNDKSDEKRGKAATLLNWGLDVEDSIEIVHELLDDPSALVRNNISRFMLHYLSMVKNTNIKKDVIRSLSLQLERPSHADRNKSLYGLLEIARSNANMQPFIKKYALQEIEYIAQQSILSKVKKPAIELSNLLK